MLKKIVATGLSCALVLGNIPSFAEIGSELSLNEAIEQAIENSSDIRDINANIPAVEEQVRKAKEGAKQYQWMIEKYETYRIMYYDVDDDYDKYIDMTSDELMEELADLSVRIMNNRNPSKIKKMLKDIDFITYALTFGLEEPDLTDEDIYSRYAKNAETLGYQAEKELTKLQNNVDLVKGNVTVGVTKLYMGILEMESGIETQNMLYGVRSDIHDELIKMYDQGLISEFDLFSSQTELSKLKLAIEKLEIQEQGLLMTLNNMIGLDVLEETEMDRNFESRYYKDNVSIRDIANKAVENSPVLEALRIDLDFYKSNYDLYQKYDGYEFGTEYEDLTYQIEKLTSELRESEASLRSDANYIIGDIAAKKKMIESYSKAYNNATQKLKQAEKQLELGLIKQTDVHGLMVSQASALMNLNNAKRDLTSAMIKLDMYVDYGVAYE